MNNCGRKKRGQIVLQGLHLWTMGTAQQLLEHSVAFEVSV